MRIVKIGPHRIAKADCLKAMGTIKDNFIDLVICDPPYGTTLIKWDKTLDFKKLWKHYERIVRPGGVIVLFGSMPFTAKVVLSKEKWFKYCLVWDKNKCGSPGLAKHRPMKVHEDIIVFVKPGEKPVYNPQMEEGEPYHRAPPKNIRCNNHKYGFKNTKGIENKGTRYPKSIIRIPRDFSAQQQVHPTQKPVKLMNWLVRTYSHEGMRVLDNCAGSGPTVIACIEEKRLCIAMENDSEHFPTCVKRSRAAYKKQK